MDKTFGAKENWTKIIVLILIVAPESAFSPVYLTLSLYRNGQNVKENRTKLAIGLILIVAPESAFSLSFN
jgi:hypothetical protein